MLTAACILTCSAAARVFFKIPTGWPAEMVVFLLIGAILFSGACVQSLRGHVGVGFAPRRCGFHLRRSAGGMSLLAPRLLPAFASPLAEKGRQA